MPRTAAASSGVRASPAWFRPGAILLAAFAGLAFHLAPQLPYGVAFDEPLKVFFVKHGTQDFHHPILMLQLVRFANLFAGAAGEESILAVGREAAALSGGLLVLAAILLARRAMGDLAALGAGLLTAVAPLTVLHAQLFKEDIFVAPWLIFGVLALDRLVAIPERRPAFVFGLVAGLAASAKYTGAMLLPLGLLPLLWEKTDRARYFRMLGLAALIAVAVFLVIDLPLFIAPQTFISGVQGEMGHALTGHLIVLHGWQSWFLFTWTANLWPGLTPPLAFAGLGGAAIVAATWRSCPSVLRLLFVFGLCWYLMHELTPMKPYPEGARHMTVMAAVFGVFAAYAAEWLTTRLPSASHAMTVAAILLAVAIVPALVSYRIVQSAPDDTQLVARRIIANLSAPAVWAKPATAEPSLELSGSLDEILHRPGFIVVNELFAADYVKSLSLSGQPPVTRARALAHEALMQRPALRISSTAGSFAFRNAPYRVVALAGDPRLLEEAAKDFPPSANVTLRLVQGQSSQN